MSAGYDCVGDPNIVEPCQNDLGQWRMWGLWSACSATCGEAIKTRTRSHTCNFGEETDSESCDLLACCDPLPWSQWSACSATCFSGSRSRSHGWTCDYKRDVTVSERCEVGPGFYSDWAPWGACSQTCSGGYQQRSRDHSCGLKDQFGKNYQLAETQVILIIRRKNYSLTI